MKTMKWLLRREFWENRGGFFWAPVIAGSVFVLINIMVMLAATAAADRAHIQLGAIKFGELMKHGDAAAMAAIGAGIDVTMLMAAGLITSITAVVVFFYSISTLYDERRDRSVLFWKSLPVSDRETVVSKVLSAAVVAPLIGMAAGIMTALLQMLVIGVFGAIHGQNLFGVMFSAAHPLKVVVLLVTMLPVWALWALPTIGWLMLVSVWAKTKPFLWALIVPIGSGIVVSWFDLMQALAQPDGWFWQHIVARMLFSVVPGGWLDWERFEQIDDPQALADILTLAQFNAPFGSLDLWLGAIAGIAMLAAAVRLRRWRDDG